MRIAAVALIALAGCASTASHDARKTYAAIINRTEVKAAANQLPIMDAGNLQLLANLGRNQLNMADEAEAAGNRTLAASKRQLAAQVFAQINAYLTRERL